MSSSGSFDAIHPNCYNNNIVRLYQQFFFCHQEKNSKSFFIFFYLKKDYTSQRKLNKKVYKTYISSKRENELKACLEKLEYKDATNVSSTSTESKMCVSSTSK